jgi:hypothetical protein
MCLVTARLFVFQREQEVVDQTTSTEDINRMARFSPGPLVSSTNKTDRHKIAEILLKVALNTIILTSLIFHTYFFFFKMETCHLQPFFFCAIHRFAVALGLQSSDNCSVESGMFLIFIGEIYFLKRFEKIVQNSR